MNKFLSIICCLRLRDILYIKDKKHKVMKCDLLVLFCASHLAAWNRQNVLYSLSPSPLRRRTRCATSVCKKHPHLPSSGPCAVVEKIFTPNGSDDYYSLQRLFSLFLDSIRLSQLVRLFSLRREVPVRSGPPKSPSFATERTPLVSKVQALA